MYVFYALVFLCLLLVWLFLSKYFVKIGRLVDKITKPFNEKENNDEDQGGNNNE